MLVLLTVLGLGLLAPVVPFAPFGTAAQAQATDAPVPARWGGAGLGATNAGLGLMLDFSYAPGARVYHLRASVYDDAILNMGGPPLQGTVTEIGLMYARGHRFEVNWGSVGAGLGVVTLERGDGGSSTTLGVPVEARLISGPRPFRIGISALGNLNTVRPFLGIAASLQFGRTPG